MLNSLALAAFLLIPPSPSAVTLSASLDAAHLRSGESYAMTVQLEVTEGWSIAEAGMPFALLHVDTPDGVILEGEPTRRQRSLFIDIPHERPIEPGEMTVEFSVKELPSAGESFGLTVLAYVKNEKTGVSDFVRQRIELPLAMQATSTKGSPTNSNWGPRGKTLQIGDTADEFSVPRADGSTITLSDYRGKKNVLITTYRAFW